MAGALNTFGGNYNNLTAHSTQTVVKTGGGVLQNILVNSAPVTSADTLTVYDGATVAGGTTIATIVIPTTETPTCLNINAAFGLGLTVVLAGSGTVGNYTLIYI